MACLNTIAGFPPIKKLKESDGVAPLGPTAIAAQQFVGDISSAGRTLHDGYHKHILGVDTPVALLPLTVFSSGGLIYGPLQVKSANREIKLSKAIKDITGLWLARSKAAYGYLRTASSAVFVPLRALGIALTMTSSKIMQAASRVLGCASSFLGGASSLILLVKGIFTVHQHRMFRKNVLGMKSKKCFKHLKASLELDEKERKEIKAEAKKLCFFGPKARKKIRKELRARLRLKKETELARVIGSGNVELLKKTDKVGRAKIKEIMKSVHAENKKNLGMSVTSLILGVLGIAATIIASVFTAGAPIIIAAALFAVVSIGWLVLDAYDLKATFAKGEGQPGRFDKLFLIAATFICLVATTLAFYLSAGIVPFIVAGVIGISWLGINKACLSRISKNTPVPV